MRCPEPLEPRLLLATFLVTNTNNSGAGSLRAAIADANAAAGFDVINFLIAGSGPHVISPQPTNADPLSVAMPISSPMLIDGYSQAGASPNTLNEGNNANIRIRLDGALAGAGAGGLFIGGGGVTIRGLAITRFEDGVIIRGGSGGNTIAGNFIGLDPLGNPLGNLGYGVTIEGSPGNTLGGADPAARNVISANGDIGVRLVRSASVDNVIQGNYIGTNPAGTLDRGNAGPGIEVNEFSTFGFASRTTIGGLEAGAGNVISGNDGSGVVFVGAGAQFNEVLGNRIGTNAAGTAAIANSFSGVVMTFATGSAASNNSIGGITPGARNIISGNGRAGVAIFGPGATGNAVQGNYIGTDITGTAAIPNANDGVRLGDNSLGAGPSGNFIGGTLPGSGNLISGNMDNGIEVAGATTTSNRIEGNLIGTIVGGSGARPNERMGILVDGAKNTVIGGTASGARNVISGNGNSGIHLKSATATGNRIEGNYIGLTADGVAGLSNQGSGVYISENASGNTVGGSSISAGNVIAYNIGDGVTVASGTRNTVRLNSIRNNNGLGIDLNFDDETLNDQDDADSGANDLQNWPEITNFSFDDLVPLPRATGFFEGKTNTTYTLDFYANNGNVPSSLGEGDEYLSTEMLTTDSNGYVQFSYLIPLAIPLGKFLTVTATDPDGNTSEFSHDADTDGLYDRWESGGGVDGDNDGMADYFLNSPNPMHKDVYVEVDAMGLIDPSAAGVLVTDAFATKPSAVSMLNPDGRPGIKLHFELDPDNIFQQSVTTMADLRAVKNGQFGTRAELINPNFAAILAAKHMTHRYSVYAPPDHGTDTEPGAGGRSWLLSHEFYQSIGHGHGSEENLAAVFMHELGHALNLGHGGGDGVNYKPNYHSLMNYMWSYRETDNQDFGDSWSLDFSAVRFFTLDENFLVEAAGIGGDPSHTTKVGPLPPEFVLEAGPIDWNRDGDTTDVITTGININKLVADENGADTILTGHDDWSHLTLNFHHSRQYREEFGLETGASTLAASESGAEADLPPDVIAELRDIGFTNKAVRIQGRPDEYVTPGEVISFTVPAVDPEGDALSFSLRPGAPPNASVHPTNGQFTFATTEADNYGEYIVTVRVVDAGSGRMREHNYGFAVLGNFADFDDDDDVDGADFLRWQRGLGTANNAMRSQGDANGDGAVDRDDLNIWQSTFGAVDIQAPAAAAEVAESSTADGVDFTSLAALWPGVDHHRMINQGRTTQPAAAIVAEARAVAFARLVNTRHSHCDDVADLIVARDERIENGVNLAAVHEFLADTFDSLSVLLPRQRVWAFSNHSS